MFSAHVTEKGKRNANEFVENFQYRDVDWNSRSVNHTGILSSYRVVQKADTVVLLPVTSINANRFS